MFINFAQTVVFNFYHHISKYVYSGCYLFRDGSCTLCRGSTASAAGRMLHHQNPTPGIQINVFLLFLFYSRAVYSPSLDLFKLLIVYNDTCMET